MRTLVVASAAKTSRRTGTRKRAREFSLTIAHCKISNRGTPSAIGTRSVNGIKTGGIAAVALWILCGAYASQFIYRGWIPHDEGTIGQSAERVLTGELPHRDFEDVYTGGLTYLHAAGMKVFGVNLRAPRLVAFTFFLAFLAAVYAIGRRVSSVPGALIAMALVTVWSLPNYFVSLPSWYNLFFATYGVLAFLRYLETDLRRWLVVAGVCGGLSMLAKISGVFYLAGGLLFLTYLEQAAVVRATPAGRREPGLRLVLAIGAGACLALFAVALASGRIDPRFVSLFVPALIVGLFVVWNEWTSGTGRVSARVSRLWSLYWPFISGAALPLIAFVLLYWTQHAVADLVRGVFILPQRRLGDTSWPPPPMAMWGLAAPYAVLILAGRHRAIRREMPAAVALAILVGAMLFAGCRPAVNTGVSLVARSMTVVAVLTGIWLLVVRRGETDARTVALQRSRIFLLITMAATVALVQFPYATPTYFFYAAPLTILAILTVIYAQPHSPMKLHVGVATFFFLFAAAFMNRSYVGYRDVSWAFVPYRAEAMLDLERGGLRVPAQDKQTYEGVVRLLQEHAAGGTIYAGPDCPEIYFLSGFPNPTPVIFDFLTPARLDASRMETLLATAPIRAAVINTGSVFSPPLDPAVASLLERRFPSSATIGRFVVRFRNE